MRLTYFKSTHNNKVSIIYLFSVTPVVLSCMMENKSELSHLDQLFVLLAILTFTFESARLSVSYRIFVWFH